MSWSHPLQTTRALCQLLRCFHGKLSTSAPWLLASVSAAWLKRVHLLDPGRFLGRLNTWLRERPVHPGHVAAGTRAWWLLREAAAILLSDERKVRNGQGIPRPPPPMVEGQGPSPLLCSSPAPAAPESPRRQRCHCILGACSNSPTHPAGMGFCQMAKSQPPSIPIKPGSAQIAHAGHCTLRKAQPGPDVSLIC